MTVLMVVMVEAGMIVIGEEVQGVVRNLQCAV
jgi:hypothetical protein